VVNRVKFFNDPIRVFEDLGGRRRQSNNNSIEEMT